MTAQHYSISWQFICDLRKGTNKIQDPHSTFSFYTRVIFLSNKVWLTESIEITILRLTKKILLVTYTNVQCKEKSVFVQSETFVKGVVPIVFGRKY